MARGRAAGLSLLFAALFVVVGLLGRTTVLEGSSFALVWPAAGMALLWFLLRDARPIGLDTLLLAAGAAVVMLASGSGPDLAAVVVVANVGQTLVAVGLLRRWAPELYGAGGLRALDSPHRLAVFAAAVTVGMAVGAVAGFLGTVATGHDADLVSLLLWFGRNLCGALVLGSVGLLVAERIAHPGRRRPLLGHGTGGPVELALAAAFTVAVHVLAVAYGDLPLAFVLLAGTVWFGTRFGPLIAGVEAALAGATVIVATLADVGLFGGEPDHEVAALVAQLYVITSLLLGLALATGREENRRLTDDLLGAEADALAQARVLDAVIAHIDSGIAVLGQSGEVLFRNRAAVGALGTGPDLAGAGDAGARLVGPVRRALAGEHVRGIELVVDERILEVSATPLPADGRRRGRVLLLLRDATTEHAHRAELLSFAGVVAHDLRNPLAAVEGWTDLIDEHLEQGDLELGLTRQFVARVRSSSARMRALIDGLLAHAQSRDRELKLVDLDLGAVVADVARARNAEAEIGWDPLPAVRADPVLARQLLDNLLGNALKYVAPGTTPEVRVAARVDAEDQVVVTVADNGIGLPAGEHDQVFSEFHRAHHREYDGSGLGLAICRRIVARHGGTIRAFDNPAGAGTVFEFTLPAT